MIEVKIETDDELLTYEFPENWDEVTVQKFCNVYKNNYDNYTEFESSMILLSTLSGIQREIVEMMDINDFKMLLDKLKFIKDEVIKTDVESIKIGEDEYYLHSDFNKFTTGEIITIEMILKNADNNLFKVMSELLCVFLRKKNNNGKLEKFKTSMLERKEIFDKIPVSQIYHIFNFFLAGSDLFNNNTKDYTENNQK
jgi:hypothetical protein